MFGSQIKKWQETYNTKGVVADILETYYEPCKFTEGRQKMEWMPINANLILNTTSAAPGFMIKNVISLPGVPSIMQSMLHNLKKYLRPGSKIYAVTISIQTVESSIAALLDKLQKKHKKFVEIGSYPFFRLGKIGISIVIRSTNKISLQSCHKAIIKMVSKKKIKIFRGT